MRVLLFGVPLCLILGGIAWAQGSGSSETLTAVDLDGDGIMDLVHRRGSSVVVYRGNVDAIFPHTPQARQRKLEGSFTAAPFLYADLAIERHPRPELVRLEDPVAVLPMRLNADAITDLVVLREGHDPAILLSAPQATIAVDTATDDAVAGDGRCAFREAIVNANSDSDSTSGDCPAGGGVDAIEFAIAGGGLAVTIDVGSALPFVTDPVTINGNTQGCPSPPCIDLNGIPSLSADGLRLTGGTSTVRGMVIRGFDEHGISIDSDGNFIEGNHVGTDLGGTIPFPNFMAGVSVTGSNNTIGGTAPAAGNLLSANTDGVNIPSGSSNSVLGNRIGTNASGTAALSNSVWGIFVGGADNVIGGATSGAGNLVSGNDFAGIGLNGAGATGNVVSGNLVGLDATGSYSVPNDASGVILTNGAADNTIGGTTARAGNVVSGNDELGIALGTGATLNRIEGNLIGTDAAGSSGVGNGFSGIILQDAPGNTVGGTASGAGNVISGNGENGVFLVETDGPVGGNTVRGNLIGTDVSGALAVPNGQDGVGILDSANNTIGGTAAGAANVISSNDRHGLGLFGSDATGNELLGNRIGTTIDGSGILGQGRAGVFIQEATGNRIGGTTSGAGNVIAGSGRDGVSIQAGGTGNSILGNSIFASNLLGIALGADGVTANDPGDADGGPNELQNYPDLSSADATPTMVTVEGTLSSRGSTLYHVEFFAGSACDVSGHGEGERFLGSANVTTLGDGSVGFNQALSAPVADGESITVTATDPFDNTSEFSACVTADCLATAVFAQTLFAQDRDALSWLMPTDVRFAKGDLANVAIYATTEVGLLLGLGTLDISTDQPGSGAGRYFLVQPLGCGSWQTTPGAEPDRDDFLQ